MLYFVFNKDIVGVVVAHDLCKGEFALQLPYHAPIQNFKEMFTKKNCEMYVRNAISGGYENGAVVDDIEVLDVKSWTMDATVADVVVDSEHHELSSPGMPCTLSLPPAVWNEYWDTRRA